MEVEIRLSGKAITQEWRLLALDLTQPQQGPLELEKLHFELQRNIQIHREE